MKINQYIKIGVAVILSVVTLCFNAYAEEAISDADLEKSMNIAKEHRDEWNLTRYMIDYDKGILILESSISDWSIQEKEDIKEVLGLENVEFVYLEEIPSGSLVIKFGLKQYDITEFQEATMVSWEGQNTVISNHMPILTSAGKTYVPLRLWADIFDAEVRWNKNYHIAEVIAEEFCVKVYRDDDYYEVNGMKYDSDILIYKDKIFLPIRSVAKSLNADLLWNNETAVAIMEPVWN